MSFLRSEYLKVTNYPALKLGLEQMEGKDWQPILDKGIKILNDCGFEWQLGSGTLLGMVREKDNYIHHDTDLDIDIIERDITDLQERIDKLMDSFLSSGFKLIRTQLYTGLPMQIAFVYEEIKLIFDLCFFYKNWGSDYCNVYDHGVFIRPDYSVDNVELFECGNSKYRIPSDYNRYLSGRYGEDWKTPKTVKESGEKDAAKYLIIL
tara:strand:- start:948 stop:1568 length:621 start_codon:yes stop_codon:yes gene_type:complete